MTEITVLATVLSYDSVVWTVGHYPIFYFDGVEILVLFYLFYRLRVQHSTSALFPLRKST